MLRSPRQSRLPVHLLWLSLVVAGCEPGGEAVPAEVTEARQESSRAACVATELYRRAADDVSSLEETLASTSQGNPAGEVTRRAGMAALEFARAYLQHAQLRAGRYVHLDSAHNYARGPADSARYMQTAQSLTFRAPEIGTIEANVVAAYDRDFDSRMRDPDHPCNWEE